VPAEEQDRAVERPVWEAEDAILPVLRRCFRKTRIPHSCLHSERGWVRHIWDIGKFWVSARLVPLLLTQSRGYCCYRYIYFITYRVVLSKG
jgi:hypothetical protein